MARSARQRSTGTKRTASGARSSRSSGSSARDRRASGYVVCVTNDEYPASLERKKICAVLPDRDATRAGLVRIVDESGEDYLYPKELFAPIQLSPALKRALAAPPRA